MSRLLLHGTMQQQPAQVQMRESLMEEEWWQAERQNPHPMLVGLRQFQRWPRARLNMRRLRLFACGCCRLIWAHLIDPQLRQAVEVAESFADGFATNQELSRARDAAEQSSLGSSRGYTASDPNAQANTRAGLVVAATKLIATDTAFSAVCWSIPLAGFAGPPDQANALICDLLRDIFGNPFRPVAFDPSWRMSTVVALAEQMYGSRDFAPMPVLADALQDAGCDHPDILAHCRGEGPHVRGCWVVDLVLGKS